MVRPTSVLHPGWNALTTLVKHLSYVHICLSLLYTLEADSWFIKFTHGKCSPPQNINSFVRGRSPHWPDGCCRCFVPYHGSRSGMLPSVWNRTPVQQYNGFLSFSANKQRHHAVIKRHNGTMADLYECTHTHTPWILGCWGIHAQLLPFTLSPRNRAWGVFVTSP